MPLPDETFLAQSPALDLPSILPRLPLEILRCAAAFWTGETSYDWFKTRSCPTIEKALQDAARVPDALARLTEPEQTVLRVVRLYGGAIDPVILDAELRARGIHDRGYAPSWIRINARWDPLLALQAKGLLLWLNRLCKWGAMGEAPEAPRTLPYALVPGIASALAPADILPWQAEPAEPPEWSYARPPAEVAFDLGRVHAFLAARGAFRVGWSGGIESRLRAAIARSVPLADVAPFVLPDPIALYVQLLEELGVLRDAGGNKVEVAARHMDPRPNSELLAPNSAVEQAWRIARAWLAARCWQDGRGACSGTATIPARKVVAWALSRVACGAPVWIDLAAFVFGLWNAIGCRPLPSSGHRPKPVAVPEFPPAGWARRVARCAAHKRWLDADGRWIANVITVTLVALGLVERGGTGAGRDARLVFRLTPEGRSVFGAPHAPRDERGADPHFLLAHPELRIEADLSHADAAAAWMLAQFTRQETPAAGPLRTMALALDRLDPAGMQALLSGSLEAFLRRHSRAPLPVSAESAIAEARRRHGGYTLHMGVTFAAFRSLKTRDEFVAATRARSVGDHFAVLPALCSHEIAARASIIVDHANERPDAFRVRADGGIALDGPRDLLTCAHLDRVARRDGPGWKIGAYSIRTARGRGLNLTAILDALRGPRDVAIPPVLEVRIRAWYGSAPRARVSRGAVAFVHDRDAWLAIRESAAASPLIASCPAPGWFILPPGARGTFEAFLREKGFAVRGADPLTIDIGGRHA